mmetsp:Transcript_26633/g.65625  ORF Transcript_26633/g.65625 Transcript_26633/m.65625 type:complete len:206 (-) Transcript_26633:2674-3291(-)
MNNLHKAHKVPLLQLESHKSRAVVHQASPCERCREGGIGDVYTLILKQQLQVLQELLRIELAGLHSWEALGQRLWQWLRADQLHSALPRALNEGTEGLLLSLLCSLPLKDDSSKLREHLVRLVHALLLVGTREAQRIPLSSHRVNLPRGNSTAPDHHGLRAIRPSRVPLDSEGVEHTTAPPTLGEGIALCDEEPCRRGLGGREAL